MPVSKPSDVFNNKEEILRAAEVAHSRHLSTPYSVSPVVSRWLSQRALCLLEDGRMVKVPSGRSIRDKLRCMRFYDRDGDEFPSEDIEAIIVKETKKAELSKALAQCQNKMAMIDGITDEYQHLQAEARALERQLLACKLTVRERVVKTQLVERGRIEIDLAAVAEQHGVKVSKVLHRPNHDTNHSVRAAAHIEMYYRLYHHMASHDEMVGSEEASAIAEHFTSTSMRTRLQVMMLFSVTGRRDETGFRDTGGDVAGVAGNAAYEEYRSASGLAYLQYALSEECDSYGDERPYSKEMKQQIYTDALCVELMGYDSLEDAADRLPTSQVLQAYLKNECDMAGLSSDELESYIREKVESGDECAFSFLANDEILKHARLSFTMMNQAHALELIRCYPLRCTVEGGPEILHTILTHALENLRSEDYDPSVSEDILPKKAYELIQYAFQMMQRTGSRTTFTLRDPADVARRLDKIKSEIRGLYNQADWFVEQGGVLLDGSYALLDTAYAALEKKPPERALECSREPEEAADAYELRLMRAYCEFREREMIADCLFEGSKSVGYGKAVFDAVAEGADHKAEVEKVVSNVCSVQLPTYMHDLPIPIIDKVERDTVGKLVTVGFKDEEAAESFAQLYQQKFDGECTSVALAGCEVAYQMAEEAFEALKEEKSVTFALAEVPEVHSTARELLGDGEHPALKLIKDGKAVVRLVDTTVRNGSVGSGFECMLNELNHPHTQRWVPKGPEGDRKLYRSPVDGAVHERGGVEEGTTELEAQEMIEHEADYVRGEGEPAELGGERGRAKNTVFAKKRAFSLLPPDGVMPWFPGVKSVQATYFPVGVLCDIDEVDKKQEKYVWEENALTARRWWLEEDSRLFTPSVSLSDMQARLAAQSGDGSEQFVCQQDDLFHRLEAVFRMLQSGRSASILVKPVDGSDPYLYTKSKLRFDLFTLACERYASGWPYCDRSDYVDCSQAYQNEVFKRCFDLMDSSEVMQEYCDYVSSTVDDRAGPVISSRLKSDEDRPKQMHHLLSVARRLPLDDVPLRDFNECLVSARKTSVKGLFAHKDTLFHRMNLLRQATLAREKYGYEVPLLIIDASSGGESPRAYTEEEIKADLLTAMEYMVNGDFPYDVSSYIPVKKRSPTELVEAADGFEIRRDKKDVEVQKLALQAVWRDLLGVEPGPDGQYEEGLFNLRKDREVMCDYIMRHGQFVGTEAHDNVLAQELAVDGDERELGVFIQKQCDQRSPDALVILLNSQTCMPTFDHLMQVMQHFPEHEQLVALALKKLSEQAMVEGNDDFSREVVAQVRIKMELFSANPSFTRLCHRLLAEQALTMEDRGLLDDSLSQCSMKRIYQWLDALRSDGPDQFDLLTSALVDSGMMVAAVKEAIRHDDAELVTALLEVHNCIHDVPSDEQTLLLDACTYDEVDERIVCVLLSYGANAQTKNTTEDDPRCADEILQASGDIELARKVFLVRSVQCYAQQYNVLASKENVGVITETMVLDLTRLILDQPAVEKSVYMLLTYLQRANQRGKVDDQHRVHRVLAQLYENPDEHQALVNRFFDRGHHSVDAKRVMMLFGPREKRGTMRLSAGVDEAEQYECLRSADAEEKTIDWVLRL